MYSFKKSTTAATATTASTGAYITLPEQQQHQQQGEEDFPEDYGQQQQPPPHYVGDDAFAGATIDHSTSFQQQPQQQQQQYEEEQDEVENEQSNNNYPMGADPTAAEAAEATAEATGVGAASGKAAALRPRELRAAEIRADFVEPGPDASVEGTLLAFRGIIERNQVVPPRPWRQIRFDLPSSVPELHLYPPVPEEVQYKEPVKPSPCIVLLLEGMLPEGMTPDEYSAQLVQYLMDLLKYQKALSAITTLRFVKKGSDLSQLVVTFGRDTRLATRVLAQLQESGMPAGYGQPIEDYDANATFQIADYRRTMHAGEEGRKQHGGTGDGITCAEVAMLLTPFRLSGKTEDIVVLEGYEPGVFYAPVKRPETVYSFLFNPYCSFLFQSSLYDRFGVLVTMALCPHEFLEKHVPYHIQMKELEARKKAEELRQQYGEDDPDDAENDNGEDGDEDGEDDGTSGLGPQEDERLLKGVDTTWMIRAVHEIDIFGFDSIPKTKPSSGETQSKDDEEEGKKKQKSRTTTGLLFADDDTDELLAELLAEKKPSSLAPKDRSAPPPPFPGSMGDLPPPPPPPPFDASGRGVPPYSAYPAPPVPASSSSSFPGVPPPLPPPPGPYAQQGPAYALMYDAAYGGGNGYAYPEYGGGPLDEQQQQGDNGLVITMQQDPNGGAPLYAGDEGEGYLYGAAPPPPPASAFDDGGVAGVEGTAYYYQGSPMEAGCDPNAECGYMMPPEGPQGGGYYGYPDAPMPPPPGGMMMMTMTGMEGGEGYGDGNHQYCYGEQQPPYGYNGGYYPPVMGSALNVSFPLDHQQHQALQPYGPPMTMDGPPPPQGNFYAVPMSFEQPPYLQQGLPQQQQEQSQQPLPMSPQEAIRLASHIAECARTAFSAVIAECERDKKMRAVMATAAAAAAAVEDNDEEEEDDQDEVEECMCVHVDATSACLPSRIDAAPDTRGETEDIAALIEEIVAERSRLRALLECEATELQEAREMIVSALLIGLPAGEEARDWVPLRETDVADGEDADVAGGDISSSGAVATKDRVKRFFLPALLPYLLDTSLVFSSCDASATSILGVSGGSGGAGAATQTGRSNRNTHRNSDGNDDGGVVELYAALATHMPARLAPLLARYSPPLLLDCHVVRSVCCPAVANYVPARNPLVARLLKHWATLTPWLETYVKAESTREAKKQLRLESTEGDVATQEELEAARVTCEKRIISQIGNSVDHLLSCITGVQRVACRVYSDSQNLISSLLLADSSKIMEEEEEDEEERNSEADGVAATAMWGPAGALRRTLLRLFLNADLIDGVSLADALIYTCSSACAASSSAAAVAAATEGVHDGAVKEKQVKVVTRDLLRFAVVATARSMASAVLSEETAAFCGSILRHVELCQNAGGNSATTGLSQGASPDEVSVLADEKDAMHLLDTAMKAMATEEAYSRLRSAYRAEPAPAKRFAKAFEILAPLKASLVNMRGGCGGFYSDYGHHHRQQQQQQQQQGGYHQRNPAVGAASARATTAPVNPRVAVEGNQKEAATDGWKQEWSNALRHYPAVGEPFTPLPTGWTASLSRTYGHYYFKPPQKAKASPTYRHPTDASEFMATPQAFLKERGVRVTLAQVLQEANVNHKQQQQQSIASAITMNEAQGWFKDQRVRNACLDLATMKLLGIVYRINDSRKRGRSGSAGAHERKAPATGEVKKEAREAEISREDLTKRFSVFRSYPPRGYPFPEFFRGWSVNMSGTNGLYSFRPPRGDPTFRHPKTRRFYRVSPQAFAVQRELVHADIATEAKRSEIEVEAWAADQRVRNPDIDAAVVRMASLRYPHNVELDDSHSGSGNAAGAGGGHRGGGRERSRDRDRHSHRHGDRRY